MLLYIPKSFLKVVHNLFSTTYFGLLIKQGDALGGRELSKRFLQTPFTAEQLFRRLFVRTNTTDFKMDKMVLNLGRGVFWRMTQYRKTLLEKLLLSPLWISNYSIEYIIKTIASFNMFHNLLDNLPLKSNSIAKGWVFQDKSFTPAKEVTNKESMDNKSEHKWKEYCTPIYIFSMSLCNSMPNHLRRWILLEETGLCDLIWILVSIFNSCYYQKHLNSKQNIACFHVAWFNLI